MNLNPTRTLSPTLTLTLSLTVTPNIITLTIILTLTLNTPDLFNPQVQVTRDKGKVLHREGYKNPVFRGNKVEKVGKVRVESECKEWQKVGEKGEREKVKSLLVKLG